MTELVQVAGWQHEHTANVVFIHGLGGDAYGTWTNDKFFWPSALAADMRGAAVYTLSYAAPASNWLGTAMPIEDRSRNILECLIDQIASLEKPIIFITHSLGGLIVKQVLRESDEQKNQRHEVKLFLDNVSKVVFLATPHLGAAKATLLTQLSMIAWPSAATKALVANDPGLRALNKWYKNWSVTQHIQHQVFYEMQDTSVGGIVDPGSGDPGLLGVNPIPIDADHVSISKPEDRNSLVYRLVKDFITRGIDVEAAAPATAPDDFKVFPLRKIRKPWPTNYGPLALRAGIIAGLASLAFVQFIMPHFARPEIFPPPKIPASSVAKQYLKYLDDGDVAAAWKQMDPKAFGPGINETTLQTVYDAVRKPLGKNTTRDTVNVTSSISPAGAPTGNYEFITYRSKFSGTPNCKSEVVTLRSAEDATWRIYGYHFPPIPMDCGS